MLESGERPLAFWRCLISYTPRRLRRRERVIEIALAPLTQGQSLQSDTWAGHLVLTNRHIGFVLEGMIPGRYEWSGAIPLEQVTDIASNEEIVITAKSYGWTWCLRRMEVEGFPSVGVHLEEVASLFKEAVEKRKEALDQEKRERRARIEAFDAEKVHRKSS